MRRAPFPTATITAFALGGAWLAGCRHAAVAPGARDGTSSFTFAEAPPPPAPKKAAGATGEPRPGDQIINAQPVFPLAKAEYPPAALAAHAGFATVGVRVTIDTEGRVADMRPSLVCLSTPSPFAAEFRAAAEAAVAQWRFRPGEVRHLELVKAEGGDYLRMSSHEKVEWTFDVQFTFNSTGEVLSGLPK